MGSLTRKGTDEFNPLRTKLFKPVPLDGSWNQETWLEEYCSVDLGAEWLRDWAQSWPGVEWFDVDTARNSKREWFKNVDRSLFERVSTAVEAVHRWNFMRCIVTMGEDWMICALALHLKLLLLIVEHADITRPGLRVLDAGCGTGYLCAVLSVLTHSTAEIFGIDLHEGAVEEGRKVCNEEDTFPGLPADRRLEVKKKIQIEEGDLVRMSHSPHQQDMDFFPVDFFDVVNVGAALPMEQLAKTEECMRDGAVLLIPITTALPDDAEVADSSGDNADNDGRCPVEFNVFKKSDGKLQGPIASFKAKFVKRRRYSSINPSAAFELDNR